MALNTPLPTALAALARPSAWPRELRDTLFVLAVTALVVLLQAPHQPLWIMALALALLLGRAGLALQQRPLPGRVLLSGLLLLALLATWGSHGSIWGQQGGTTLIVLLLALKTLELRARRDALVIFFLGFFSLLTLLLHSQSLLTALGIVLALLGLLSALVLAHLPVGRPPLWLAFKLAAVMTALGAPLMLLLFLLFPRFGPLWSLPNDGALGRSGLSDQMQVGQIARLALDQSIAFRVEFEPGQRPTEQQLYFRGPVLSLFDGLVWRPLHGAQPPIIAGANAAAALQVSGQPIRYRLTLEPSNRPWLLALEATPELPAIGGQAARLTPDLQWLAAQPVAELTRFEASAFPNFRLGPLQPDASLQIDLQLPAGFNPRTLQLAADLRQQLGPNSPPQAWVDAVLLRLRTGGYQYTLEPGLFGRHSADEFWFDRRQGFCEHIAASFVVLMRALGIPARVVTGYHGGELNPVDGVWTVRQSDAHAWSEVWLAGQGWVRVDPTAHVAPARTSELARLLAPPGLIEGALINLNPTALAQLRSLWEATNNRWNQWVLNHGQTRQFDWLRQLGIQAPQWHHLLGLLAGLLALAALGAAAWLHWLRPRPDPWLRLLQRARRLLQKQGYPMPPEATPRQLAHALLHGVGAEGGAANANPTATAWADWLLRLEAQRYDPSQRFDLAVLHRQWRHLPPLPVALPSPAHPSPSPRT
ncbi:transglutaminase family protein [Serpentinimonas barnesii]|uniref:transglutaminase family protein n=1 Tax=Serpentinimonas barnesii TaxID=1458427 RepID=UPI0005F03003|nr:DUF3488 and transglutaminase-like domain-containing protein [Serpentinimonas barnesii]